jgi:hypothetical protein
LRKDQWVSVKDRKGNESWLKGKAGFDLYNNLKATDKLLNRTLQPVADYDDEYDLIYINWGGKGGVKHTAETHTKDGKIIRFDFNKKDIIVGVEIEGLVSSKKEGKK